MPVSGSSATDPGRTGVLSTMPVAGVPVSFVPEGNASESGPAGEKLSWTTADDGVEGTARGLLLVHDPPDHAGGEERDRHRHEDRDLERDRPADALRQHGEDEPDRRHERRHDGTQIALFLIAVRVVSVENSVW